jgi:hypothetical protein
MKFVTRFCASAFLFLLLGNCRKEIAVPDPALQKLFGKWTWAQSSGGFAGTTTTPSGGGTSAGIEFRKDGICIISTGKKKDKMKFTLSEGKSIFSTEPASLITYEDIGLFDKNSAPPQQSVRFSGPDTLLLNDECYDCFSHLYVRNN